MLGLTFIRVRKRGMVTWIKYYFELRSLFHVTAWSFSKVCIVVGDGLWCVFDAITAAATMTVKVGPFFSGVPQRMIFVHTMIDIQYGFFDDGEYLVHTKDESSKIIAT